MTSSSSSSWNILLKHEMEKGQQCKDNNVAYVLIDFSLTVKAVTLIFISGREKSGSFYNLVKN